MGCDKAWLTWEGRPLILRQIDLAREAGAREVFVSGRRNVDYSCTGVEVLLDREEGLGPMSGLERGLEASSEHLLLVLAVDLPRLGAAILRQLAGACRPGMGVVPVLDDRPQPVAAFYPRALLPRVREHRLSRRLSMRGLVQTGIDLGMLAWAPLRPEFAGQFRNWNTPSAG